MTGFDEISAANRAAPSMGCLNTIASQFASTTLTVSAKDSPFSSEVVLVSLNPTDVPPIAAIADSKLNLVLVLGSKNICRASVLFQVRLSLCIPILLSCQNIGIADQDRLDQNPSSKVRLVKSKGLPSRFYTPSIRY